MILLPGAEADQGDLADPNAARRVAAQAAVDALRTRFGEGAIGRGRGFVPDGTRRAR
jgi:DNA polymerase-4